MPAKSIDVMRQYVDAVINEWHQLSESLSEPVETIYFGGGTPSLLPSELVDRLMSQLPHHNCAEITIEANPEQITPSFIQWLKQSEFNRVSIGIQSLDDTELATVGRNHDRSTALNALKLLHHNIPNYSVDIIYGLPRQTLDSLIKTLSQIASYHPPHISAYMLSYEKGTRLDAMLQRGRVAPLDDDTLCEMYNIICTTLSNEGYDHYEISNFAKSGMRAVHNSNYWLDKPYIGLGAGAHSFIGNRRIFNTSNLLKYIENRGIGTGIIEEESTDDRINDHIMVSLRTSAGIDSERFIAKFGAGCWHALNARAQKFINLNKIKTTPSGFRITEEAWLTSDDIIASLFV